MSLAKIKNHLRIPVEGMVDEMEPPPNTKWKTVCLRGEAYEILVMLQARDVLLTGRKMSMTEMVEALLKIAAPVIVGHASIVKTANEMEVANAQRPAVH